MSLFVDDFKFTEAKDDPLPPEEKTITLQKVGEYAVITSQNKFSMQKIRQELNVPMRERSPIGVTFYQINVIRPFEEVAQILSRLFVDVSDEFWSVRGKRSHRTYIHDTFWRVRG